MANRLIMKNSTVAGKRPATGSGSPGEIFVNVADKVIGTFDASGNPIELGSAPSPHGVALYDATKTYSAGDLVVNAGVIYRAGGTVTGAWDATKWAKIADTPKSYTAGSVPFADTDGSLTEDNNSLFWDKANKRLGVGTKAVGAKVHASENGAACIIASVSDTEGKFSAYNNSTTNPSQAHFSALPGKVAFNVKGATGVNTPLVFQSVDIDRMTMSGTGQLGIGVAPTANDPLLTVNSGIKITGKTTAAIKALAGAAKGSIEFSTDENKLYLYDGAAWYPVGSGSINEFDASKTYNANDIVTNVGKIYRAKGPVAAGAFDATKWDKLTDQTFTAGSIPFADTGGALTEDNAALFWDKANKGLYIDSSVRIFPSGLFGKADETGVTSFGGGRFLVSPMITLFGKLNTSLNAGNITFTGPDNKEIMVLTPDSTVKYVNGSTERARLTTSGQLGIGVVPTATDPLLTVNSDAKINGVTVGRGPGAGLYNTVIGGSSFGANLGGERNTSAGTLTLSKNQSGNNNCALGMMALTNNVIGSQNTAIGSNTLMNNNADGNTAIGFQALANNIVGKNCFGLGHNALANSNADNNIAIGTSSGQSIQTGSGNVVIGSAPGEAAMNNTVIIADGAGGEKIRWTDTGAMQIGQTAEPTGIAGKLHLWFNGTNLMMKVGTGAATIVK